MNHGVTAIYLYHLVQGGYVKPWLPENHLPIFWENSISLIQNFIQKGYDVVFNYICSPSDIEHIKECLPLIEIKLCVLMADEETIMERDKERPAECQMGELTTNREDFYREHGCSLFLWRYLNSINRRYK